MMDYSFTTIGALIGMAAAIIRNKQRKPDKVRHTELLHRKGLWCIIVSND